MTLPTITPQLWESGLSAGRQIGSYLIPFLCEKGREKYQKKPRVQPLFRELEKFFFQAKNTRKPEVFAPSGQALGQAEQKNVKIDPAKRLAKCKKTTYPLENQALRGYRMPLASSCRISTAQAARSSSVIFGFGIRLRRVQFTSACNVW